MGLIHKEDFKNSVVMLILFKNLKIIFMNLEDIKQKLLFTKVNIKKELEKIK